jgi:hypothetical protein
MDATDEVLAVGDRLNCLTLVTEALWPFLADQGHTERAWEARATIQD